MSDRQTYRMLVDRCRAMMLDFDATVLRDQLVMPFVNMAQLAFHDRYSASAAGTIDEGYTDINIAAASGTTIGTSVGTFIDWSSTGALPDTFMIPYRMFEKDQGTDDSNFAEMSGPAPLPNRVQDATREIDWDWSQGQIRMVGCTTARTFRIFYRRYMPEIVDLAGYLQYPGSLNALMWLLLAFQSLARGMTEQYDRCAMNAEVAIDAYVREVVKAAQSGATRRAPYSANPTTGGTRYI